MTTSQQIARLLSEYTFTVTSEVSLHEQIATVLQMHSVSYEREVVLDPQSRLDFLCDGGVAIEAKIAGTGPALARQLHRYARHERVSAIVAVVNIGRLARLPMDLHGKALYVVRLSGGFA